MLFRALTVGCAALAGVCAGSDASRGELELSLARRSAGAARRCLGRGTLRAARNRPRTRCRPFRARSATWTRPGKSRSK
eukprot:9276242-Alexandrium_andersonii.AAC.1